MVFKNDSKDRKRRFLRGLNHLLGLEGLYLENPDILIKDALKITPSEFRIRLANVYGLELTNEDISRLVMRKISTGAFTEHYCKIIYRNRGNTDLNSLLTGLIKQDRGRLTLDLRDLDSSLKYGLNGGSWCDVAEGPCSCGAWHR